MSRGRPSSGLSEVLYIRAPKGLVEGLDKLVAKERKLRPGVVVSRSDLVREILYEGLKR